MACPETSSSSLYPIIPKISGRDEHANASHESASPAHGLEVVRLWGAVTEILAPVPPKVYSPRCSMASITSQFPLMTWNRIKMSAAVRPAMVGSSSVGSMSVISDHTWSSSVGNV